MGLQTKNAFRFEFYCMLIKISIFLVRNPIEFHLAITFFPFLAATQVKPKIDHTANILGKKVLLTTDMFKRLKPLPKNFHLNAISNERMNIQSNGKINKFNHKSLQV